MDQDNLNWPTQRPSEPTSSAQACVKLCIFDVRFPRSGFTVNSHRFIERHSHGRVIRLRHLLRRELHVGKRPRLVCPLCGDPLNIAAKHVPAGGHSFYFSHVRATDVDKALCPYRAERPDQSQVEAWKYFCQRESEAHRQMKARIARSLACSEEMRDIVEEKTWIGARGWRKPDVSATQVKPSGQPVRLAFEAQLSTTFVSTIIQRQHFYRTEGAALVWVLRSFDPTARRMTTEDIWALNNDNVIVVNEATEAASRAASKFMVEAHWHEPFRCGRELDGRWCNAIVPFDHLTVNPVRQCSFYVDVAARAAELRAEINTEDAERRHRQEAEEAARQKQLLDEASKSFIGIMLISHPYVLRGKTLNLDSEDPLHATWCNAVRTFRKIGIDFPAHPAEDPALMFIVWAIVSAQRGSPAGWSYKRLVQVGHLLDDRYKFALLPFGKAARAYGRQEQLAAEDTSGKWAKRSKRIRAAIAAGDPAYVMPQRWKPLLSIAFPDVFAKRAAPSASQVSLASDGVKDGRVEMAAQHS